MRASPLALIRLPFYHRYLHTTRRQCTSSASTADNGKREKVLAALSNAYRQSNDSRQRKRTTWRKGERSMTAQYRSIIKQHADDYSADASFISTTFQSVPRVRLSFRVLSIETVHFQDKLLSFEEASALSNRVLDSSHRTTLNVSSIHFA